MNQDLLASVTLGRKLGQGFFGEVHEAEDRVLGKVALKVFRKQTTESDAAWQKRKKDLLDEGLKLRAAQHDRVVQVFQVLEHADDNSIYMMTELCTHGSLEDCFDRGPMPLNKVRSAINDVTLGLQAIHARDFIHRDIKPGNILLDAGGRAKIADFGLVTDDLILGYAGAIGYKDHLAHECWTHRTTSIRTDIWALGMTVYRLLHGKQFYNESPAPRTEVPHGGFASRLLWLPHVPDEWRRFVRFLMRDDPADRCQNTGILLNELGQLPISPSWECEYSSDIVTWTRVTTDRRIKVTWSRKSLRQHEWIAQSFPLNQGRAVKIKGSEGYVNRLQAERDLKQFFERYYRIAERK